MIVRKDFRSFLSGFVYAGKGLWEAVQTQFNIRFHFFATIIVICMSFYFKLSGREWCFVILSISMVLTAELLNTAIEYLTDLVSPEHNYLAGKVKDIASAAVFITALCSAVIGFIVFLPYFLPSVFPHVR
jgi:diacylglycerol kinase